MEIPALRRAMCLAAVAAAGALGSASFTHVRDAHAGGPCSAHSRASNCHDLSYQKTVKCVGAHLRYDPYVSNIPPNSYDNHHGSASGTFEVYWKTSFGDTAACNGSNSYWYLSYNGWVSDTVLY